MTQAQWVKITVSASNCDLSIGDAVSKSGDYHRNGDKNANISVSEINKIRIYDRNSAAISSCGNWKSGSEGSFNIYDGDRRIGSYYWNCPFSPKDNKFELNDPAPGYRIEVTGGNKRGAIGDLFINVSRQTHDTPPSKKGGFTSWEASFKAPPPPPKNAPQILPKYELIELKYALRNRINTGRPHHLVVFVHGVDSNFDSFNPYIDCLDDLLGEFGLCSGADVPSSRDDISLLGIEWESQKMMGMLISALMPGEVMPSKVLAEDKPHVTTGNRLLIDDLGKNFFRVRVFYGFMETPDIPMALELCGELGLHFDMMSTSFFISRAMIVSSPHPGMMKWRERLFIALSKNAMHAADFFKIPSNRVIEMGSHVEI